MISSIWLLDCSTKSLAVIVFAACPNYHNRLRLLIDWALQSRLNFNSFLSKAQREVTLKQFSPFRAFTAYSRQEERREEDSIQCSLSFPIIFALFEPRVARCWVERAEVKSSHAELKFFVFWWEQLELSFESKARINVKQRKERKKRDENFFSASHKIVP